MSTKRPALLPSQTDTEAPGGTGAPRQPTSGVFEAMSWRHRLFLLRRAAASSRSFGKLPGASLERLFSGIEEVEVSMSHRFRPRGLPHGDAFVLALVAAWTQPARIFEIGTGTGEGTMLLAQQAPTARVDTLDLGRSEASLGTQRGDRPLDPDPTGRAFRGTAAADRIEQHLGDSARFDFGPFANQMDLVFVDGAHTFDYAISDSRAALEMIGDRGVIVWDDCHLYHPGVSRALLSLSREGIAVTRIWTTRLAALVRRDG